MLALNLTQNKWICQIICCKSFTKVKCFSEAFFVDRIKRDKAYHYILCNDICVLAHRLHKKYLHWQDRKIVKLESSSQEVWLNLIKLWVNIPWTHSAQQTWEWALFFLLLYLWHQRPAVQKPLLMQPWHILIHCMIICHADFQDSIKDSPPPVLLQHSGTAGHH